MSDPPAATGAFRTWVIATGTAILGILVLLAAEVFVFDPFMHYHAPWFGYGFVSWKETYLNPGLAQHENYNAVIVGGSYVQNTRVSQVNALFGVDSVKFTDAGGTPANMDRLLEVALDSGRAVRLAIVALPVTKFEGSDVGALRHELPEYLYDDEWLNDLSYLWNSDVYIEQAKALWYSMRHKLTTRAEWLDAANAWFARYQHKVGKHYLLAHYSAPLPGNELRSDFFVGRAAKQFDAHIRPALEEHPGVVFKVFFPPFSLLLWRDKLVEGTLRAELEIKRYLASRLLEYPNVEVYDFMTMPQVSDLDNYKDRSHYLPVVNDALMEELTRAGYRMKAPPTEADLDAFVALVRGYDDPDIPRETSGKVPNPDNIDNF